MPINKKNIIYHELIGLKVKITSSPCDSLAGLAGMVIDETLNNLIIKKQDGSVKQILKKGNIFMFTLPDGEKIEVPGQYIIGRPWERLKHVGKKKYKNFIKNR
ncbi:MAG: ribonuclease P protein component 1 [Promethearchaeota archaeon]